MTKKQFSALVKTAREKSRLSQIVFGLKLGVSWMTILRWERGISCPKPDAIGYWIEKITETFPGDR